jgi:hypothetical protein
MNGCRYNERLNTKTEGTKRLPIYWVPLVKIIVRLVTGLVTVVTSET